MKPTILLCYPVTSDDLQRAQAEFPQYDWRVASRDSITSEIAVAEIVFGKPSDEALAAATNMKWLQATSAGVESLAASPVFQRARFTLTTASGMHESCAQHAIALLLGFTRRVSQHARLQDKLHWKSRKEVTTPDVLKGTLGIVGFGTIGRRVAQIARVLGMKIIGVSYRGLPDPNADEIVSIAQLDSVLPRCDALVLILPATRETDNLLNAERLAKLPKHCIVVNVGRGNAIDEAALLAALKEKRIAGAALDVFAKEPLPDDSPLYYAPNLIMTPHIGGNRPDYDACAFEVFLENLRRYSRGEALKNIVERERGY
ncbi:MAG TPA: D-2-hydroxyacid dehydrogenase [Planctomycetota bacterium]|nr:D-2-hydroxyacid dehydrogenase [Planctomycetota bacterium]